MAGESDRVGQDEIEQLLKQAQGGATPSPAAGAPPGPATSAGKIDQAELDALLASSAGATSKASTGAAGTGDSASLKQAEIEALLSQQQRGASGAAPGKPQAPSGNRPASDVEFLLSQAEQALAS